MCVHKLFLADKNSLGIIFYSVLCMFILYDACMSETKRGMSMIVHICDVPYTTSNTSSKAKHLRQPNEEKSTTRPVSRQVTENKIQHEKGRSLAPSYE